MNRRDACGGVPAATTPNALSCEVRKRQGAFSLNVSLDVPASGVTALFGPSGSGKTTLLRLMAGLDRPDSGRVTLGERVLADTARGVHLPIHHRGLGVVFQEARLFPHYRVRSNLTYGMPRDGRSKFDDLVALLGIQHLLDRMPGMLSGGEARRVAIGRALLTGPRLLLMDEPLTGLDGERKGELLRYLVRLTREIDIPVVYVSHDPAEITAIADHLAVLEDGQVAAYGELDALMLRLDLTQRLGGFDAATRLTGKVMAHDPHYALTDVGLADGQRLRVPMLDLSPSSPVRLRVGVRDVAIALRMPTNTSYRNGLWATVEAMMPSDHEPSAMELRLVIGTQRLRARLTRQACDELQIIPGKKVVALIRSVSFDDTLEPIN
ncbi:molybdenum ABC transporter ATP-binding protein [Salinicola aestuarinus]|uniref:molybdenum ABC transporter ATP-binding protein n=1 Tax=Salinicola aestuarinus TaxID=1949082 RepID=UPI001FDA86BB|nr:molybdenum ABC transporter ATP-binding protein [Salinicola aestuarinus]